MAPTRTPKLRPSHVSKRKPKHIEQEADSSKAPGVQKLKASIRQTRRLLAKDNLAADKLVETERRLKSLEAELAEAEVRKRERELSVKYHKVKFFERKKVLRKLNRIKRKISSTDSQALANLEEDLFELRVQLNYIRHFPKTRRYMSLFPPEVRHGQPTPAPESSETSKHREEFKQWIREQMRNDALSNEPENNEPEGRTPGRTKATVPGQPSRLMSTSKTEAKVAGKDHPTSAHEEKDAFFASGDSDSESQSTS